MGCGYDVTPIGVGGGSERPTYDGRIEMKEFAYWLLGLLEGFVPLIFLGMEG